MKNRRQDNEVSIKTDSGRWKNYDGERKWEIRDR